MPDFLDALIGQTHDALPALRPRTPGLFEPQPARPAPGDRFGAARSFSVDDLPEAAPQEGGPAAPWPGTARLATPPAPERAGETWPAPAPEAPAAPAKPRAAPPASPLPARLQDLGALLRRADTGRLPDSVPPASPRLPQAAQPATGAPRPDERQAARPVLLPAGPGRVAQEPVTLPSLAPSGATGQSQPPAVQGGPANPPGLPASLSALAGELQSLRLAGASRPAPHPADLPRPGSLLPPVERPVPPVQAPLLVQVSIGRVEVRAAPAAAPAKPVRASGAAPASLDEYLRRINGGSR